MRTLKLCALFVLVLLCASTFQKAEAQPQKNYVMGPLGLVTNWDSFRSQLEAAKKLGVEGITTDIWWGIVEPTEGHFDWTYYKKYAETVKEADLNWIPILSTHAAQYGSSGGDTVDVPLPTFVWSKSKDMHFKGSNGFLSKESISVWSEEAFPLFKKFYESFRDNFYEFEPIIKKIYVGMGPSGELRYPSYNPQAGWNYPDIGSLQAYSDSAQESFRTYVQEKYKTLQEVNEAWGTKILKFKDIVPPRDGDHFFIEGFKSTYGKDLLTWYQKSLEEYLIEKSSLARDIFKQGSHTYSAPLAVKIAGIHWKMGDPVYPHGAEYAAGYFDYDHLFKKLAESQTQVTFTCLEMDNSNFYPDFSLAGDLVAQIAKMASEYGLKLSGENASPLNFGGYKPIEVGFKNIQKALKTYNIAAFTLLRLENLIDEEGRLKNEAVLYHKYLFEDSHITEMDLRHHPTNLFESCTKALGRLRSKILSIGSDVTETF